MDISGLIKLLRDAISAEDIDKQRDDIIELIPKVKIMVDYNQQNHAHQYDLWEHREQEEITIRFSVNDNALIYWALQYGKMTTIIAPDSIRAKMENEVKLLADKYLDKT